ncbi:MAG: DUF3224 domain-containing protein [Pirellulaceae bacterium]
MRNKLGTSLGSLVLAATIAALAPPTAWADPPQPASGDFVVEHLVPTSIQPRGAVTFIELTAVFRLEDTFDGAFTADFSIVHLGALDEPAQEIFFAEGTFEGEVDAATGTFDFVFVGGIDAEGFAEGKLVILRGTGDLANLQGWINLAGVAGVEGSYEGHIQFAP